MKFLQHQHILTMIGVEADAVPAAVVGDTANAFPVMLLENAPCLSRSACAIEIGHFQRPVFGAVLFLQNSLTEDFDLPNTESELWIVLDDLHNRLSGPEVLNELEHFRGLFLLFGGEVSPFLKGAGNRSFRLVGIGPMPLFENVGAVCLCAPVCFLNMRRGEAVFDGGKAYRRGSKQEDMRVIGSGCRYLIRHTEIGRSEAM